MNNFNEVKEMLEKLNQELESLRIENKELKFRLAKYESIGEIDITIEELDLSTRSYNCLARAGLRTVTDILRCSAKNFYAIRDFGTRSQREVIEKMEELGFNDWASKMR